jgi:serine/threonine protein kinase
VPDVGDVLDGYRLDAVLGRGGMGTVYRATDLALEKTVALKIIAPHLADDDTFVQRFREEAKALARLDADGIVDVFAMRETEAALFFVMEHVEGPSLDTILQRRGALDPSEALSLLRQVLDAVGQAHASGVLHRDLKPSNILFDADGRAVITDFGLAKILTSDAELTATHEQLGTVAYMSPEQVEGLQNVDEASDLFSVGLIAYESLTGRLPFDRSESDFRIQRAIVEDSFPPPSTYAPEVPLAGEQVVLDLLAKDPAARPPDAHTARERLPVPQTNGDAPILDPDAVPTRGTALSFPQWIGLAATVVLVLVGTYAGVRATLGLPVFSVSAPTPPDTTNRGATMTAARKDAEGTGRLADGKEDVQTDPPTAPPDSEARTAEQTDDSAPSPAVSTSERPSEQPGADESRAEPSTASEDAPSGNPPSTDAPAPDAAAPGPSRGVLSLRSQPDGATVQVDGAAVGRTPLTLDDVAPGRHRVALQLPNHRPFETTVTVPDGDTAEVAPDLMPRLGIVRLRVVPSGEVRIDGTRRPVGNDGTVVDSLSPGAHRLVVISNLGRWEIQIKLGAGERLQRTVDFTQRVEVAVTARTPEGRPLPNATVRVDGETVGYTPQRLTRRVGQHTIRVERDDYLPAERTVQFDTDMDSPMVFELSSRTQ